MRSSRMGSLGVAFLLLAMASAAGLAGGAVADAPEKRGLTTQIKMKFKNGIPRFKGPDAAPSNGSIEILNKTNPAEIGPHTFSLVKKSELPGTEAERKKCGKNNDRKLICKKIANAHDMTGLAANEPVVDNGVVPGWDKAFTRTKPGDSWFTETQDETHLRTIEAPAGKRLFYMCIIHPKMQGKITIAPVR